MQFRFRDAGGVPVSDWFFVQEDETVTIPYNFTGISGWPFRSGTIEARGIDFWNNVSNTSSMQFQNHAPPTAVLNIISKDSNSFQYVLDPDGMTPSDFSGVLFFKSTTQIKPDAYSIKNSLNGELVHNLNSDTVYTWWAIADTFSMDNLNYKGPFLIENGPLGEQVTGLSLILSGHEDDWRNQYYTLYASWQRTNSGDIQDYLVFLKDDSGNNYDYMVGQTASGHDPYFHFDSVIPDRTYQVAVQSRNSEGRKSALSAYTVGTFVPKPKIRFLQVEGKSYFFEPTYVSVSEQNVVGTQNVDFSKGNIMKLNLTNSSLATVSAINIQSGSTYLIYVYRNANNGDVRFSSQFKWPDGEPPEISTSPGAVDVISAFAINSDSLYAVAVNNMS
jgi:hypothetical protein